MPSSLCPPQRHLGQPQMAFVRCWAEGLDLVLAWQRFMQLDGPADARRARAELRRLLDQLRGLARAHGRPDIAALLQRDPAAVADSGPAAPTLAQFAQQQPADFYSEAELQALYAAEFGQPDARSAARRRQRLRERLVLALQWLERQVAQRPQPDDAIAAWLDARVAQRLATAGLLTLAELAAHVAAHGSRWHRVVPKLGPRGAARIQHWLLRHGEGWGALSAHAPPHTYKPLLGTGGTVGTSVATAAQHSAIVPLERFAVPAQQGADHAALLAWLDLREPGSNTWRAYRKEAERFLLWAVLERGKPLSALDPQDCQAYRAFLQAPGPAWTAPRHVARADAGWRPFEGPLSPRSVLAAENILRAMCRWLVSSGHWLRNPWHGLAPISTAAAAAAPPALPPSHWQLLQAWLSGRMQRTPSPALQRLQFILAWAQHTGLRRAQLAHAQLGWLRVLPQADGSQRWLLRVPGAAGRGNERPLAPAALQALRAELARRGLQPEPLHNPPGTPLIARLHHNTALSPARLHEVLNEAFAQCAQALARQDPAATAVVRQAGRHWLQSAAEGTAAAQAGA